MDNVKKYLKEVVFGKKHVPYIDILVTKDGETVYRTFDSLDGSANGNEFLFMYSMTKPITAVATMILVERGVIKLDDELSKYIPAAKNAFLIKDGVKVKPKKAITIKQLLTMSSGLDYNFETDEINSLFNNDEMTDTLTALSAKFLTPLADEPDTRFIYSLSYDMLGGVIEVASGMRFADFVEKEIFIPLEMNNSTLKYVASGTYPIYDGDYDCSFKPTTYFPNWRNSKNFESGGAGLKSTVEDYSKFTITLANNGVSKNGYRLISKESVDLIATPFVDSVKVNCSYTALSDVEYGYGFGVRVRKQDTEWGLKKGEFGWDGAACSFMLIDRENNVSIVIGMNATNWPFFFSQNHIEIVKIIYKDIL